MQKFLGRALEARGSCNCAICSPIGPGLARNANNTLPAKRRLKFSDVVNVVYGTIIGTAALWDGTVKNNRRRAVDNALLGLLEENEAVLQNQEARLRALGYEGTEDEATLSEDVARHYSNTSSLSWNAIVKRPSLLKPTSLHLRHYSIRYLNHEERCDRNHERWRHSEMQTRQEERVFDRLQTSTRSAEYMSNARHRSKDKKVPNLHSATQPQARFIGKPVEEAWKDLTIIPNERTWQIRETAVAQLVLKLLKTYLTSIDTGGERFTKIQLRNDHKPDYTLDLEDVPRIMQLHNDLARRIEDLKLRRKVSDPAQLIGNLQFPRFTNYRRHEGTESYYHSHVRDLNDKIASIFIKSTSSEDLISRICNVLVSCSIGPDIHTMNILLVLFLDIQWYQACRAVIQAISAMAMNQNEVTDMAKLQFYHLTQQDANLDNQRACMLASDGRVTRAAFQPGNLTTDDYHPEQVVAKLTSSDGKQKLIRGLKAGWTAESFSIVIIDLLDRGELQEALTEIAIMQQSDLQETPDVLEALLQYSVFNEDWDLAIEAWNRFEDLGHERSVLTWYWMLQACASCQQADSFHQLIEAGKQQGILDRSIEYLLESFELSSFEQSRLKLRVHALRRLRHGIPIPRLPERDLHLQEDEIIQMPNLQKTMLMVYLQQAKLHNITYAWFVDHLDYLRDAETQFERVVGASSATPQMLQHVKAKWSAYNIKLQAIESTRHSQSGIKSIQPVSNVDKIALEFRLGGVHSAVAPTRQVRTEGLLESLEYHRLIPRSSTGLLEVFSQSGVQRTDFRNTWSSPNSAVDHVVQTTSRNVPEHTWHYAQYHNLATEPGSGAIRYTASSASNTTLRKVFTKSKAHKVMAVKSTTLKDDTVDIRSPAIQTNVHRQISKEYVVPRPASAPPRVYHQDDIESDEVFRQDLRLVAAAC